MTNILWDYRPFDDLTLRELYALLKLRQAIFVVEQNSIYRDLDDLDFQAQHLMGWREGDLVAYLRILAPGVKYPEHAVTRVVVKATERGTGLGYDLMREAMRLIGPHPIRLSGQVHLAESFYGKLGFHRDSEVYDDEGLPHVQMIYHPPASNP